MQNAVRVGAHRRDHRRAEGRACVLEPAAHRPAVEWHTVTREAVLLPV